MSRVRSVLTAGAFCIVLPTAAADDAGAGVRTWLRSVASWFGAGQPAEARLQLAQAKSGLPPPEKVAVPPPPRFDIQRFDVQGNTLLTPAEIAEAVAPYTGASKDFADVQRALEALQRSYQRRGYGAVQVLLPEQELEAGVIVLRVIEPRIGKVTIEGNEFFDEANIRRSLPALQEGTTPNAQEIGRDARLANENPVKRASVLLRSGAKDGEIDATVRVQDEKFWRAAVSFDNTGSPSTGMYRLGFAYQHANLFDRDNVLTLQYQLDPEPLEEADKLKVFGAAYRIPFYGWNSYLDLLFGYSDIGAVTGQVIQGVAFNFSGSGTVLGARYTYLLPRLPFLDEYDHRISVGVDYKAYTNQVAEATNPGANLTPDVTIYPFSLTYTGTKRMESSALTFYASVVKNFFPHGADATPEVFRGPPGVGVRPGVGDPRYHLFRYGLNYVHALPHDVQMRINFTGQWTRDALVPGEQFGLGGFENLRGLYEREGASDRGYRASFELYSPDVAPKFGLEGGHLRFLGFLDFGKVRLNHSEASEPCGPTSCGFSAASIGVGMRLSLRQA